MGLRRTVRRQPQATTRFSGGVAPQIGKDFLNVLGNETNSREAELKTVMERRRIEQLDFIKAKTDNESENDVIQANAELSQVEGLNALTKSQTIQEKLKKSFEKRKSQIPEQFHPYVEQIFDKKMTRYNKFAVPYTAGQASKVNDEVQKTYVANSMMEAVEDSGNLYEYNGQSLAKVSHAIAVKAQKQFGDQPELIQEAINLGVSKTHRMAIEAQATTGRIDKAEDILDTFNHELTPDDRNKAIKQIEKSRRDNETNQALSVAQNAALLDDPAEADKYLQDRVSSAAGYSAATAALRTIKKAQKDSDKFIDGKTVTSVFKDLQEGKPLDPDKLNSIKNIDTRNKIIDDINRYGGIENRVTDQRVKKTLVSQMFHDREGFKSENLEPYQVLLSPEDYKFFVEKQNGYKEVENKRQEKIDYSTDKLIQDLAKDNVKSALDAGDINDSQTTDMYLSMMEFQDRLVRQSKGMSERDIRRVFAERVSKFKLAQEPTSILWGLIPTGSETVVNKYIPVMDHTEEEIDIVREKTSWPTEKILKFLDFQKSK